MSILNPLKNVIESKSYPLANAQRTTFWQKTLHTFLVFSGNLLRKKSDNSDDYSYKQVHVGVYDYLTLGVPLLLTVLITTLRESVDNSSLEVFFGFLNFIINIPRYVFAAALTLVCLPFIALAHTIASPAGGATKAEILAYQVETEACELVVANTTEIENTNNCFIFLSHENKLVYKSINGDLSDVPLNDVTEFKKELGIQEGYYPYAIFGYPIAYISKEDLKRFLTKETKVLETYHTLGQILEAKGYELEELVESEVELINKEETKPETIRLTLKDQDKKITCFNLSLSKSSDLTLFGNLRRLNIAGVDNTIEEDLTLFSANLPG